MKKCAVIIVVNKTGGLPVLSAAASGATEFADWAATQGFDVTLLTDDNNATVSVSDIKKAIGKYVDTDSYSQLIVFFAGHGILKGPNDEYWLLSGAPGDPNEAVNFTASKYYAYNIGIPHIIIISDACRSIPSNPLITQVSGGAIFPNKPAPPKSSEIDTFFATKPGDAAYEVKDEMAAAKDYKGIFTHCMLLGLNGKVPELFSRISEENKDISVVFPYELKLYLEKRVPIAAGEVKITLNQNPRIEVISRPPAYLAKFAGSIKSEPDIITKGFDTTKELIIENDVNLFDNRQFDIKRTLNASNNKSVEREIDSDLDKLISAQGRESFETQTGFSVIGTDHFDIMVDKGHFDIFEEQGYKHIRLYPGEGKTMLLITATGFITPMAILPGFIGSILVENDRVINVNYLPSRNSNKYHEALIRDKELSERRAAASLAARHGSFQVSGDQYAIMESASYLRYDKAFDPTLGLFAAYAYIQAGNNREVNSVFEYMARENEPILFDVKLLATLSNNDTSKLNKQHAPFCPMLSQGWSYLSINKSMNNSQLSDLARYLEPGLWTTFKPEAIGIIRNII